MSRVPPTFGGAVDLAALGRARDGVRTAEATPQDGSKTVIERVVVVLKAQGELTREDVALVEAYARHAAEAAAGLA